MTIDGIEIIYLSNYDGRPIKNHLPEELKKRLWTENQWLEKGFIVKEGMKGYEMHSNMMGKKLFTYFLDNQVEKINEDEEICATCRIRENRYCIVMGDYINMTGHCSEWQGAQTDDEF